MDNTFSDSDIKKFFESIPPEELERQNQLILKQQELEYTSFKKYLRNGQCYICGLKLNEFNEKSFCLHWFTYPNGIKKKHFEKAFKNNVDLGFFNLDAYFRWLANSERYIGNINDLKSDVSENSFLETTYKYKNLFWAFSVGHTDLEGHKNSKVGSVPHYHIEMKVNDNIFIKFNDFHLPFNDEDLFKIEAIKQIPDNVITTNGFDTGMSFLEDENNIDLIRQMSQATDDHDNATLNYQSIIIPDKDNPITGQMLKDAMDESKKTGKLIGEILSEKVKNANSTIIISPGDGVPKMSKRSGKK
jgi:hypothetical protein